MKQFYFTTYVDDSNNEAEVETQSPIVDDSMLSDKTNQLFRYPFVASVDVSFTDKTTIEDGAIYEFHIGEKAEFFRVTITETGYRLTKDNPNNDRVIELDQKQFDACQCGKVIALSIFLDQTNEVTTNDK